jgi:hypothetical protein
MQRQRQTMIRIKSAVSLKPQLSKVKHCGQFDLVNHRVTALVRVVEEINDWKLSTVSGP